MNREIEITIKLPSPEVNGEVTLKRRVDDGEDVTFKTLLRAFADACNGLGFSVAELEDKMEIGY